MAFNYPAGPLLDKVLVKDLREALAAHIERHPKFRGALSISDPDLLRIALMPQSPLRKRYQLLPVLSVDPQRGAHVAPPEGWFSPPNGWEVAQAVHGWGLRIRTPHDTTTTSHILVVPLAPDALEVQWGVVALDAAGPTKMTGHSPPGAPMRQATLQRVGLGPWVVSAPGTPFDSTEHKELEDAQNIVRPWLLGDDTSAITFDTSSAGTWREPEAPTSSACRELQLHVEGFGEVSVVCRARGQTETWDNIFVGKQRYGWNGKRWGRGEVPPSAILAAVRAAGISTFPAPDEAPFTSPTPPKRRYRVIAHQQYDSPPTVVSYHSGISLARQAAQAAMRKSPWPTSTLLEEYVHDAIGHPDGWYLLGSTTPTQVVP